MVQGVHSDQTPTETHYIFRRAVGALHFQVRFAPHNVGGSCRTQVIELTTVRYRVHS